jgi:hypothetical protein
MKLLLCLGVSTMAALLCVVFSITVIECVLLSNASAKLYNPVSLLAIAIAALLLTSIALASGWIAATGFTLTYISLSLGLLLLNASLYSLETLFIPILGSILLLGELLLLILPAQALLRWA